MYNVSEATLLCVDGTIVELDLDQIPEDSKEIEDACTGCWGDTKEVEQLVEKYGSIRKL
jgi:hypothetical protein